MAVTHRDLVDRAVRWLRSARRCKVVLAEIVTYAPMIPDAIGWNGWLCEVVEAKRTRSDFFADRHKGATRRARHGGPLLGHRRWYLTPPGLVCAAEVPEGWGLAEAHKRKVVVVLDAPPTPPERRDIRNEMLMLVSAARRHELGARWDYSSARFESFRDREIRMLGEAVSAHEAALLRELKKMDDGERQDTEPDDDGGWSPSPRLLTALGERGRS